MKKIVRSGIAPFTSRSGPLSESAHSTFTDGFPTNGGAAVVGTTEGGDSPVPTANAGAASKTFGTVGSYWDSILVKRLGSIFLWPWVQPENYVFFS